MENKQFQYACYLIECLSNLHAGSGDANYGVIDKLVQRDPTNNLPTVHASSLKGALREYFEENTNVVPDTIKQIFGHDVKEKTDFQSGKFRFFPVHLLVLPVRSNQKAFYRVSSTAVLDDFVNQVKDFAGKDFKHKNELENLQKNTNLPTVFDGNGEIFLEDLPCSITSKTTETGALKGLLGCDIALANENQFQNFAKELPVIARNQLEDGVSQNLWYEEVVPRQSRFYTFVAYRGVDEGLFEAFNENLHQKIVQVGANASIGYGFCKFTKIDL